MPHKTARIFFIDPEIFGHLSTEEKTTIKAEFNKIATIFSSDTQIVFFVFILLNNALDSHNDYLSSFLESTPTSTDKKQNRFSLSKKHTLPNNFYRFLNSQNTSNKTLVEKINAEIEHIKASDKFITGVTISIFTTPETVLNILPAEKFLHPVPEIKAVKSSSLSFIARSIRRSLSNRVYCIDATDLSNHEINNIIGGLAPSILKEEALLFFINFTISVLEEDIKEPIGKFTSVLYDPEQLKTLKKSIFTYSHLNVSPLQPSTIIDQINQHGEKATPIFSDKIIFFTKDYEHKNLIQRPIKTPSFPQLGLLSSKVEAYLAHQEKHSINTLLHRLALAKAKYCKPSDTETSSSTSLPTDSPPTSPSTSATPPKYIK